MTYSTTLRVVMEADGAYCKTCRQRVELPLEPPQPKPRKWTLEQLREAWQEWPEYDGDIKAEAVETFIDWLGGETA